MDRFTSPRYPGCSSIHVPAMSCRLFIFSVPNEQPGVSFESVAQMASPPFSLHSRTKRSRYLGTIWNLRHPESQLWISISRLGNPHKFLYDVIPYLFREKKGVEKRQTDRQQTRQIKRLKAVLRLSKKHHHQL